MLMGAGLRVQILLSANFMFVSQSFDNIHGTHKTD